MQPMLTIDFMLRAENAAFFTNRETYGTASRIAVNYLDPEIKQTLPVSPPEVLANINCTQPYRWD